MSDIYGDDTDEFIYGSEYDDYIEGQGGNDQIYGLSGDDTIVGGAGNDYLNGGAGYDFAAYFDASNGVVVDLLAGTAIGLGSDTLVSIEGVLGSLFDDVLSGDDLGNVLIGLYGNDEMHGRGGNDAFLIADGNQIVHGGSGEDSLSFWYMDTLGGVMFDLGAAEASGDWYDYGQGQIIVSSIENLEGTDYDDYLVGDAGANIIVGETGADVAIGGAGDDILVGDGFLDFDPYAMMAVFWDVEDFDDGNDVLDGGDGDDLLIGGGGQDELYGGNGDDALFGGSGDDWIEPGAGADQMNGDDGIDTVSYEAADAGVAVYLFNGATGGAAVGDTFESIENLVGSFYDDNLRGDAQNNVIMAGYGDDVLRGMGGDDILYGEDGNDLFIADGGNGQLYGGSGFDIVHYGYSGAEGAIVDLRVGLQEFAHTSALGAQYLSSIEGVIGTAWSDQLDGNSEANLLVGWYELGSGENNDVIRARAGDDFVLVGEGNHVVLGGEGNDILEFGATDVDTGGMIGFVFDLTLQGGAQDTGRGVMTVDGFEHATGSIYGDQLTGDAGANQLSGGSGDDMILGGAGNDVLRGDAETYMDDRGWYLEVAWNAIGNDRLFGEEGDDLLHGEVGDDFLDGGDGRDQLWGDEGNDHLSGGGQGDRLDGGLGDDILKGGAGADQLEGGEGHDILRGNGGSDMGEGGAGADQIYGGGGADALAGGAGSDLIAGGGGGDRLFGNNGNDQLSGDGGNDWLDGGFGDDVLSGGSGNDIFYFGSNQTGADMILDFMEGDTIAFDTVLGLEFADLVITEIEGGAEISWLNGDTITVLGDGAATLDAGDFWFGAQAANAAPADPQVALSALAEVAAFESSFGGVDTKWSGDGLELAMVDIALAS